MGAKADAIAVDLAEVVAALDEAREVIRRLKVEQSRLYNIESAAKTVVGASAQLEGAILHLRAKIKSDA